MNLEKLILYVLTFFVDVIVVNELLYFSLSLKDLLFCVSSIMTHVVFYYSLYNNYEDIIGVMHVLIGCFIFSSFFLDNVILISLCIFLLICVQYLWVIYDRCIINDFDYYFIDGYSKPVRFCTILFNVILSIKLGYLL